MKIAYVKWIDSTSYEELSKDDEAPLGFVENAGIIKDEDDEKIVLGFYWNHTEGHFTHTVTIPKFAIKRIRRFTIPD